MIIIGHRGAASYEPENTLLSIGKAIDLKVNAVEIDVHLTKDNNLVVIHDDKVDKTTNNKGYVKNFNLSELKKLDAGKNEKIPTLQEVIDFVKGKIKLIIELKGLKTAKPVVRLIEKNKIVKDVYVISFWHDMVKEVKELNKNIKTGVLFVGHPVNAVNLAKDADADVLVMNYKFISKKLVDDAHKSSLKVFVWNIDDKEDIKPIADLKVDAIGSNKPDIIVEYFKKK